MRILNQDSDSKIDEVTLYLTRSEAEDLRDSLDALIKTSSFRNHRHVSTADHAKTITVCLYTPGEVDGFSERSKRLILNDV